MFQWWTKERNHVSREPVEERYSAFDDGTTGCSLSSGPEQKVLTLMKDVFESSRHPDRQSFPSGQVCLLQRTCCYEAIVVMLGSRLTMYVSNNH